MFRCNFCGKSNTEVTTLISSPAEFTATDRAYICNECVYVCMDIVENLSFYDELANDLFPKQDEDDKRPDL